MSAMYKDFITFVLQLEFLFSLLGITREYGISCLIGQEIKYLSVI